MSTLPTNLRRQLETAIKQARKVAESGARKALEALAVHEPDPYRHMDEGQRDLRRKLRAQAKQLGDGESLSRRGAYEIKHLVEKLAYDQWHRLLFARFLVENDLLISPEHGVSVSLDDCEEIAPSFGLKDAWGVAARFAARELPEIFRADDPAGAVELPVEDRKPLIHLVKGLPREVFVASDSLGWCYQFWQAERKDEVNAAGNKIGADELPAVTQLFTEDYMVDFLLDNTIGSWHAGKVLAAKPSLAHAAQSEEEIRNAVALPGCTWKYLRCIQADDGKWSPAAGTFDGWPKTAQELRCLDPCMGSGHFVVAMFERLVALRMAEEKLDEGAAVAAVIRDNLFGLEIDPRCTQIGAFNLALAAWRRVGYCMLPAMNVACSGLAPNAKQEDWLKLGGDSGRLQNGMEWLYQLFKDAPILGSLINPRAAEGDLLVAAFHELQPLLEKALAQESKDDTAHEMAVTARGVAKAAEILAGQFTLVATNVPYRGSNDLIPNLNALIRSAFPLGRSDLATCFLERCIVFCSEGGTTALVSPQSWLFIGPYRKLREHLLKTTTFQFVAQLGKHAFETIGGEVVNVNLTAISRLRPRSNSAFSGLDVSAWQPVGAKATALLAEQVAPLPQLRQLENPDARIVAEADRPTVLLRSFADSYKGIATGDLERFIHYFWEHSPLTDAWSPLQGRVDVPAAYGGREQVVLWEKGRGQLRSFVSERLGADSIGAWLRGDEAWQHRGIAIGQMTSLPCTIYLGDLFDENTAAVIPKDEKDLPAMWAYCQSQEYRDEVKKIDNSSLKIPNLTLIKVPFDVAHWQKVAAEQYPQGLPKPFSSDPTQWLFNGQPRGSDQPLHVHAYLPGWDLPKVNRELLTNHFGLVSDFLSECWNQLRRQSRQNLFQGRVHLGGALSGRDTTGIQKTVSGLIKLVSPNPDTPVPEEVLEWALRIALECRRRVKEQQKRIGSAEFRNTQFSYSMGDDGVEKFVATPELYSENSIGSDPLPPGQVWVISPGGGDENPGLYQVNITEGPGSGVKVLNQPAPPPFKESVRCAEQNLYVRAQELVGDRDPRQHEFSIQLRAFDSAKSGTGVGVGVLLALCSSLLQKSIKGGLAVTGGLNLGGSIETIFNPVAVVEIAIEKGAASVLMPISSRRQLNDLPDDLAAKITIHYYLDARDALLKSLAV